MGDFLFEYWSQAAILLGSAIMWLSERAKRKADTQVIKNDAATSMQEMYSKFVNDFENKYTTLEGSYMKLKDEYVVLSNKFDDMSGKLRDAEERADRLEAKLEVYKKERDTLTKRVENYKKEIDKIKKHG